MLGEEDLLSSGLVWVAASFVQIIEELVVAESSVISTCSSEQDTKQRGRKSRFTELSVYNMITIYEDLPHNLSSNNSLLITAKKNCFYNAINAGIHNAFYTSTNRDDNQSVLCFVNYY